MNNINKWLSIFSVNVLMSQNVFAIDQTGSLGELASASDYYEVICSTNSAGDTSYLQLKVKDLAPTAKPAISAQISRNAKGMSTSDLVDGDANYSQTIKLAGGNGSYFIAIDKNQAGVELYSANIACMNAQNKATAIKITNWQDQ